MSMSQTASGPNQQILEEASVWFVTLRGQDPAATAARDFHDWLKRSPEHIRAYLEIAAIYADIPAPEHSWRPAELVARARSSPELNVISLNLNPVAGDAPTVSDKRSRVAVRIALAASVLICAFVGAWLYIERNTYGTSVGEQRSITMADGSIVELNARSKVRISFNERQRDVELIEGQALFRVAKDRQRPFVVHAGMTSVRAVGTQFDVNRKSSGTVVTVLEGRVAVLSATTQPTVSEPQILLASGEQMTVTRTEVRKVSSPDLAAATAWTQHLLVFDGTALGEVLEEFSRHSTRRIVVDSPELAALKISGQYTSTNPDSLLRFLSLQPGVSVSEVNGEIHIRKE
jgi:transmembrane sensor